MLITVNFSGPGFNAIDYLAELELLPGDYHLFELEPDFDWQNDEPGFALHFDVNQEHSRWPFKLLRFLVVNEDFLLNNSYRDVPLVKELIIHLNYAEMSTPAGAELLREWKLPLRLMWLLSSVGMEIKIMQY